jgi:hypothetical protein
LHFFFKAPNQFQHLSACGGQIKTAIDLRVGKSDAKFVLPKIPVPEVGIGVNGNNQ